MKKIHKKMIFLLVFLLIANGAVYTAFADHDDYKEKKRYQKRERRYLEHNGKHCLSILNNPTYTESCGDCHFPYQPGLLPSGSWDKILNSLEDHFGEDIELEPKFKKIIVKYLHANAANYSSSKISAKIMKCLGHQTPLRITEIPYIRKKHHEIQLDVFKRESIGSFSNCSACHKTAEKGIYDDDNVLIPR